MRVVAWNCRSGFQGKVDALLRLAPDVAVVPEAGQAVRVPGSYAWVGDLPHKGLGVVAPAARVTPIAPLEGDGRWALACDVVHDGLSFGLKSAWHDHTGEVVGQESAATLWWRGKEEAGFHCDFVFVPRAWEVTAVQIGSHSAWGSGPHRSDHAPVIVDVR